MQVNKTLEKSLQGNITGAVTPKRYIHPVFQCFSVLQWQRMYVPDVHDVYAGDGNREAWPSSSRNSD